MVVPDGQYGNMLFNYESFENLIKEIASFQYTFLRFDERAEKSQRKIIYLRHDVDISPLAAAQLGKIENSLGVKASFFFQIGTETYNIFCHSTLKIVEELRSFGHCVGLHIDELLFRDDEHNIYHTLKWFNQCITDIDFVVSFHRPTESVLYKKYESFINTYQKEFFSPDNYLSDSRRNKEFYPKLLVWLEQRKTPVQLLLHPDWWYPEYNITEFMNTLIKRRNSELKDYLRKNFFKVFGGLIEDENCTFGL